MSETVKTKALLQLAGLVLKGARTDFAILRAVNVCLDLGASVPEIATVLGKCRRTVYHLRSVGQFVAAVNMTEEMFTTLTYSKLEVIARYITPEDWPLWRKRVQQYSCDQLEDLFSDKPMGRVGHQFKFAPQERLFVDDVLKRAGARSNKNKSGLIDKEDALMRICKEWLATQTAEAAL